MWTTVFEWAVCVCREKNNQDYPDLRPEAVLLCWCASHRSCSVSPMVKYRCSVRRSEPSIEPSGQRAGWDAFEVAAVEANSLSFRMNSGHIFFFLQCELIYQVHPEEPKPLLKWKKLCSVFGTAVNVFSLSGTEVEAVVSAPGCEDIGVVAADWPTKIITI